MQSHASVLALSASLLIASAAATSNAKAATPQAATVAGQHTQSDSLRAAHILNRLTFGSRPGDLENVLVMGVDKWIQQQLRPEAINDSVAQTKLAQLEQTGIGAHGLTFARFVEKVPLAKPVNVTFKRGDSAITVRKADSAVTVVRKLDSLVSRLRVLVKFRRGVGDDNAPARIARTESSERQLLEVITDFWQNHFSVYSAKMPSRSAITQYERDAIRPFALGKFRDLLGAVAHTPAMMFYLDNHLSVADSAHLTLPEYRAFMESGQRPRGARKAGLNENYARELLELHTLGVDGGYTQNDVIEVARAFTGWSIDAAVAANGPAVRVAREQADVGGNFLFREAQHDADEKVVLGQKLAAGRGIEDGEQVLDILARHPSTARYIAGKLAVRLVSDSPSEDLIARAAATFTRSDGDIRAVVETIVTSEEFFAPDAFRSKVKSPYELVLAMRRALGVAPDAGQGSATLIGELSQPLWGKETPDGWPETGSAWMTSGTMFNRVGLAMRVARGEVPEIVPDSSTTWRDLAGESFDKQVGAVVRIILAGSASQETRDALASLKPARDANGVIPDGRETLQHLIAMAFSSPEFQRR